MLLTVEQQLNLLDLYDNEIKSRLSHNLTKLGGLEKLVSKERIDEVFSMEEAETIAELLWSDLRSSALNNTLYKRILMFMKDVDVDLHAMLDVGGYCIDYLSGFFKMLRHSGTLLNAIDSVHGVLEALMNISGYEEFIGPLKIRHSAGMISDSDVRKILLRFIPLTTTYGYDHLLYAIYKSSTNGIQIVLKIYPNFISNYEFLMYNRENPLGLFHIIEEDEKIFEKIKEVTSDTARQCNTLSTRIGRIIEGHQRSCIIDFNKEIPMLLRKYQEELVIEACRGQNVIICAPTGSGKTIVSTYIVRSHLYKAIANQRKAKICFIVPTAALVEQQKQVMDKYLSHCATIRGICGNSPNFLPNRHAVEQSDIVVVTPQIIVNLLKEKPLKLTEDEFVPFRLTYFTLLIFDEAHHANEKHPYNEILQHYHELKRTMTSKLPQIVGLTASLGIGRSAAKDCDDAIIHLLTICANMDVHHISRVRKNVSNLASYTSNLEDFDLSQEIRELLRRKGNRIEQGYETWIHEVELEAVRRNEFCATSRATVGHCTAQLMIFSSALSLLRLFGSESTMAYILEMQQTFLSANDHIDSDYVRAVLMDLSAQPCHKSELFEYLLRVLNEQFESQPESRVLIFLSMRDHCRRLSNLLNKGSKFAASFLTGQVSAEKDGTKLSEMKKKLSEFANGTIKILCVTTVAEEGIDISECNLVIEYNNVSNEIARIQRRGRGRAMNAKMMLLTLDNKIKERAEQNAIREELMTKALDDLDKRSNMWFRKQIDIMIERLYEERMREKALEKKKNKQLEGCRYSINCRRCDGLLVYSNKIAVYDSLYLVVDKQFWSRVSVGSLPSNIDDKLLTMPNPHVALIICAHNTQYGVCLNRLGRVVLVNDVQLPTISCKNLVFVDAPKTTINSFTPQLSRYTLSQWKSVCEKLFSPQSLTDLHLKEMQLAEPTIVNKLRDVMKEFQSRRANAMQRKINNLL